MAKHNETDWWWVDFLEGEFESEVTNDLEALLEFSKSSRSLLNDLKMTKTLVETADPAHEVILEGVDWGRLHSKIMQKFDAEVKKDWNEVETPAETLSPSSW